MDLVSFESSLDAPTPPSGLGPAIKEKPRPKPGRGGGSFGPEGSFVGLGAML